MKSRKPFFLIIIAVILGMVIACDEPEISVSSEVVAGETLAAKLQWIASNAVSNTNYSIEVNNDEYLNPHILSYGEKSNITIQLTGIGGKKVIQNNGTIGSLFLIGNNVTLILNENIVLKGKTDNTTSLVMVKGNLILNDGSKITGNISSDYGGGVLINSGTFTMNGGEISGNTSSSYGGGVYIGNGTFTMTSGEIYGNTASSYGGGVYVGNGTFTITSGEIYGNTASSYGGGVYISAVSKSEFKKTGGIITGYLSDTINGNVVKNNYNVIQNNCGHAVYAEHSDIRFIKYKEFTSEQENNLTYIRNEPSPITISGDWNLPIPDDPGAPVVTASRGSLIVQWTTVERALSYEVWVGTTNNPEYFAEKRADVLGTSTTLTDLVNGTTYNIWLKAKNDTGASGFSPMASGTPSALASIPPTPMTAPSVSEANAHLVVSWQEVEGAISYEVWLGTTDNPTTAEKHGDDVSNLFLVIDGLTNHTTYYVWIKAKNDVGTSDFSPTASGTPSAFVVIPQAPSAPILSLGDRRITVSWTAVEGALAYEVWLGTSNNSAYASKHDANIDDSLLVTIDSLVNGTTYYVWIKAKNEIGTSGFSPTAIGMPMGNAVTPTLTASNGQLTATWSAIAGANQYEVFYGTGTIPPQTASQTVSTTTATITGLVNGKTYNVWVRGKNSTGTGAMSNAANAKPIGMGIVMLVSGNGQLTANWSAGADQYEVYYNTSNSIPTSPAQTVTVTTATISGLTNGTTYYVWVKAKNANGSSTSTVVNAKPLGTPGLPTLSSDGYKQILVTWTAVPGAEQYEVYYGTDTPTTLVAITSGTSTTIAGLKNGTNYSVSLRAKNANGISEYGPIEHIATETSDMTPGLYRGTVKIGDQNLSSSLSYISANAIKGDNFYIVLGEDEYASPMYLNFSGKTVGITLSGYGEERTVTLASTGSLFTISNNVTFTLDENISLVSTNTNNTSLVRVDSNGTFAMNGGTISGNTASSNSSNNYGGGVYVNGGAFTMTGGTISGNTASGRYGGGVYVSGTFNMTGGTISGNTAGSGGGVYLSSGTFNMTGGTISENTASSYGGGVFVNNGTFTMNGGTISENTAPIGGGINVDSGGTITMNGGIISRNTSSNAGGGISANDNGNIIINNGTINGNKANYGGGILVTGTVTMNGGIISENTGSGIYVSGSGNGTFTIHSGTISGNTAGGNGGGGIYVDNNGTITMHGGTISGNTASTFGGGVYVYNSGTFTMNDGTISGNTASNYGGGVSVYNSGTFTMNDGTISGNTASNYGGGVFVDLTYDARSRFEKTGGIITGYSSNTVNGNVVKNQNGVIQNNRGHAVYVSNNTSSLIRRKETTAGQDVNLYYDGTVNPPSISGEWDE